MKPAFFIFSLVIATMSGLKAQVILVNPDGTHSLIIDNGATKTVVNPNGTHSTIIDNGATKTVVNPKKKTR